MYASIPWQRFRGVNSIRHGNNLAGVSRASVIMLLPSFAGLISRGKLYPEFTTFYFVYSNTTVSRAFDLGGDSSRRTDRCGNGIVLNGLKRSDRMIFVTGRIFVYACQTLINPPTPRFVFRYF